MNQKCSYSAIVLNCWLTTRLKKKWEQDFNSLPLQLRRFLLHPKVCPQLAPISFAPLPSKTILSLFYRYIKNRKGENDRQLGTSAKTAWGLGCQHVFLFSDAPHFISERALSRKVLYLLRHAFLWLRQNIFASFCQYEVSARLFSFSIHSVSVHYRCRILDPDVQEGHTFWVREKKSKISIILGQKTSSQLYTQFRLLSK